MLPLIVFAVGIAVYNYKQDRSDATRRVLENVRSMRLVLDSEVQRMTGGLQVACADEFAAQRRLPELSPHRARLSRPVWQGRPGADLRPQGPAVVLLGHGRHCEPASPRQSGDRREGLLDQGAAIFRPVHRRDQSAPDYHRRGSGVAQRRGDLRPLLQPADRHLSGSGGESGGPTSNGRYPCSTPRAPCSRARASPGETFGKRASPSLYAEMFRNDEASLPTVSLDGVALAAAYTRSRLTGWTVAAGVAESSRWSHRSGATSRSPA